MAIVYRKSLKGVAEIETRSHRLAPRQRAALILVDGRKTDLELAALIPGEPRAALAGLLADGFIDVVATLAERETERKPAPAPAAGALEPTRRDAVRELNDQLGPSAEGLAIKIERCTSMAELQALLAQAVQLLRSVRGKAAAESFAARFIAKA